MHWLVSMDFSPWLPHVCLFSSQVLSRDMSVLGQCIHFFCRCASSKYYIALNSTPHCFCVIQALICCMIWAGKKVYTERQRRVLLHTAGFTSDAKYLTGSVKKCWLILSYFGKRQEVLLYSRQFAHTLQMTNIDIKIIPTCFHLSKSTKMQICTLINRSTFMIEDKKESDKFSM